MNVEAVRDDGALLVTAGSNVAVIVAREGTFATTAGAALARGEWRDPVGETIPADERVRVRELLAQVSRESEAVRPSMIDADNTTPRDNETRRATRVAELQDRVQRAEAPDDGEPHRRDDRAGAE